MSLIGLVWDGDIVTLSFITRLGLYLLTHLLHPTTRVSQSYSLSPFSLPPRLPSLSSSACQPFDDMGEEQSGIIEWKALPMVVI